MYHPLDYRFLYSALKLGIHVVDENGTEREVGVGTGFLLRHNNDFILCTNRHVVEPGYSDPARRHWRCTRIIVSGCDEHRQVVRFAVHHPDPVYPANYDEDVALVYAPEIEVLEGSRESVDLVHIGSGFLADDGYFEELNAGDFVVFPGWPEWHDVSGNRPIMRSGILASDPFCDYAGPGMSVGARRLAFEGFSFEGSSGSPVYALACGLALGEGLTGGRFRPAKLIGVNAGHLRYFSGVHQHSGISIMMKSTVVHTMLNNR